MRSRLVILAALLILIPTLFSGMVLALSPALGTTQQRVTGHGMRGDAQQFSPDISGGRIVWQDLRGTSTTSEGNAIWSKDLSTRDEAPVSSVSTNFSPPSISGDWVVWADASPLGNPDSDPLGNSDIYARQLPSGPVITVTANTANQSNPSIDGTVVVWEDQRTATTTATDIYKKDLSGGSEAPVTTAAGDQRNPKVSGSTIVWEDNRRGYQYSDIYSKTGESETVVALGTNYGPAISSSRVVWNRYDSSFLTPASIITCVLPCATTQTVSSSPDSQYEPDVSGSRIVWTQYSESGSHIFHKDMSGGSNTQVNTSGQVGEPAIDGTKVVWQQSDGSGDIYWRDLASGIGPMRVNSVGMGPFADHVSPSASSADNLVVHKTSPAATDQFQVFATNLNGSRRDYAVSSYLGASSAVSPPRIAGSKTVWSDFRNCAIDDFTCTPDVFTDNATSPGSDQAVTTTARIGNPPDIDGTQTVWLCGTTRLCLDDAGADSAFNLPVAVSFTVQELVRIDNGVALWSEINFTVSPPYPSRLHALKLSSGEDSIMQEGTTGSIAYWDLGYDISGSNLVWSADEGIYKNTISFPCGSSCNRSGSASLIAPGTSFSEPSLDANRVVFSDCAVYLDCNILLQDIGTGVSQTVTSAPADQTEPFIDGDRVYWTDERDGHADVYMTSISGAALPAPDTTAPSPVTGLTAGVNTGSIAVSWTNPSNIDLLKVRVLRKSGTTAASGPNDTTAMVVFDALGTSFTDSDVISGLRYTYSVWAYDTEGNLSSSATATSSVPAPAPGGGVLTESLGGVLIGGPDSASWSENHMSVFVIGSDKALWQNSWTGSNWTGWGSLGGSFTADPTVVSWGPDRLDVFGRGADNALWHAFYNGSSWSGWESLGGFITSAPDASSWGSGRLDVFAKGGDNALWQNSWTGSSWSGWGSLGGIITSDPSAVSWGTDRIDLFGRGADNALWQRSWNGSSWSGWGSLGGILIAGPDAASTAGGGLDVFVIGSDKAAWRNSFSNGSWTGWGSWGGIFTSDPTAVSWSADRLDMFARGGDNALWHKWQDGSP